MISRTLLTLDRNPEPEGNPNPILRCVLRTTYETIGINLDSVERDYEIKQEAFETQDAYENAILDWMYQVWASLPVNEATEYAAYSRAIVNKAYTGQLEADVSQKRGLIQRYQQFLAIDLDRVAQDYGIRQEDFETQREYKRAIDSWWFKIWIELPQGEAQKYAICSPSASIAKDSLEDIDGLHNIHGVHLENVHRDCGFTREQFGTDEEYNNAVTDWWRNVWAVMPPNEARKYALYSSSTSYEESIFQNLRIEFHPNIRDGYLKMIGLHVGRIGRDFRLEQERFQSEALYKEAVMNWWKGIHCHLREEEENRYSILSSL